MSLDRKYWLTAVCCAAVFSVPVLVQGASLAKADADFMNMAAKANMTEAHLGQMAEAQAGQKQVKEFGQKLSQDHTTAYEGLSVLANKTGDSIPKAISKGKTIEQLTHLKGARFDHAFLMDEVTSHKTELAAFQNEAEHGENADVKAWAKSMIPTLQEQLQQAETLAKPAKPAK